MCDDGTGTISRQSDRKILNASAPDQSDDPATVLATFTWTFKFKWHYTGRLSKL
jgi:hypothetical protein